MYPMDDRTTIQVAGKTRQRLRELAARRDANYQELLSDMIDVFSELDADRAVVSIPTKLYERASERITDTDFRNVSEYVTFLLRLLLLEQAEHEDIDEERIKKRLSALGYL